MIGPVPVWYALTDRPVDRPTDRRPTRVIIDQPASLCTHRFLYRCALVAEASHTPGVRRSGRQRVAPLKFWKGDNIQYGVDEDGLLVAEGVVKGQSTTPAPSRYHAGGALWRTAPSSGFVFSPTKLVATTHRYCKCCYVVVEER